MIAPEWRVLAAATAVAFFCLGLVVGALVLGPDAKTIDSRTVPTLATVTLAPNGMAYCPADPSTPHPTPCVNP